MNKIKVCVVGAGGRVGRELLHLIFASDKFSPTLGIGRKSTGFEYNGSSFKDFNDVKVDVVIDFSSPELIEECLDFCLKRKIPFVSGTTGLSDETYNQMTHASKKIPILWSPNMSLGVALFKKCMNAFAGAADFDYIIEEWHHRHKKDSPSGTAIMLGKHLESKIKKSIKPIVSYRTGGIYGVHKMHVVSDEEHLSIEHTALNRAVFAKGSLVGAEWLLKKDIGLYNIDNVLGDQ
jgi:4-hydroxy-tetrahydrodipicolinate reductase